MAKRLFSFAMTDEDEPDYFAKLMQENNIEFYIVPGSVFGFTKPSFWITHDDDFDRAKMLFKQHEEAFAQLAREKYQMQTGYNPNAQGKEKYQYLIQHFKRNYKALIAVIIGFALIIWYFSLFFGALTPEN